MRSAASDHGTAYMSAISAPQCNIAVDASVENRRNHSQALNAPRANSRNVNDIGAASVRGDGLEGDALTLRT
ncbi:hypothetical protein GCM10027058_29020 [Microbacterium neimengense]